MSDSFGYNDPAVQRAVHEFIQTHPAPNPCEGHYDDNVALIHGPYSCDGSCQPNLPPD